MSETLKPCPFCGGEDLEIEHRPTYMPERPDVYNVHCCDCGANGSEEWTERVAIEAWNTRYERTCTIEGSCYDELWDESFTDLSCGHRVWEFEPNYCVECGAKVVIA